MCKTYVVSKIWPGEIHKQQPLHPVYIRIKLKTGWFWWLKGGTNILLERPFEFAQALGIVDFLNQHCYGTLKLIQGRSFQSTANSVNEAVNNTSLILKSRQPALISKA